MIFWDDQHRKRLLPSSASPDILYVAFGQQWILAMVVSQINRKIDSVLPLQTVCLIPDTAETATGFYLILI
ncbi:hypothetical protein AV530_015122 [Patagioenas fasciata monilis]|uniref:Uncharacterized protein n=1 Tax=Patagioenas fasciata monilis TaxID=372326 RepID=A0A1V4K137_PATFA|nr:hypothetical protein AV530_015122 [Patagioenas fasciata monilis]